MTDLSLFTNEVADTVPITNEQIEGLLNLYADILPHTASDQQHTELLGRLCTLAEALVEDSYATIMHFNEAEDALYVSAAPSLPPEAVIALNGLSNGEGSCGNAVFHNQPMYVNDTFIDARWDNIREFAEFFGIGSCWSHPVRDLENRVVGTFALSSKTNRKPDSFQRRMLEIGASIAGVIFQREQSIAQMRHLADHDALTGATNRRRFQADAQLVLTRLKRTREHAGIIFLDVDNFKWINDDYGHDAGDEILKFIAQSLISTCRDDDLVCRWGGDEFVVMIVCKDNCPTNAEAVLKRIMSCFEEPVSLPTQDVKVKISCGVSLFPSDSDNLQDLIHGADMAMLKAKSAGRNRIEFYHRID